MRSWLIRLLSWLLDRLKPMTKGRADNEVLECYAVDKSQVVITRQYRAVGATGIMLRTLEEQSDGGKIERLIGSDDAVDRKHFWRLWKRLAGNPTVTWADGSKVDLERL